MAIARKYARIGLTVNCESWWINYLRDTERLQIDERSDHTLHEYNLTMAYDHLSNSGLYIEGDESDMLFFLMKYS
jgi:hypothetical protein